MLTREFLILPALLVLLASLRDFWATRRLHDLAMVGLSVLSIVCGLALPRWLIPVGDEARYVELFVDNPQPFDALIQPILSIGRSFNLVFVLLSYGLPLMVLGSPARLRAAWRALPRSTQVYLVVYSVGVLGLTLNGGKDLARFVTYLYVPQVILLALILREGVPALQTALVLCAMLFYNRILQSIPTADYNAFLDFYGGYHNRVNSTIIARAQELTLWLFAGIGLRGMMTIYAREQQAKRIPPPAAAP